MREYLESPADFFAKRGLTRMGGQPVTMGVRIAVPYIRAGGWILLIYGVWFYRKMKRLRIIT